MSGLPRFSFRKDGEPFSKFDGAYTERQWAIINETLNGSYRMQDVVGIIKKARARGDDDIAQEMYERHEEQLVGKRKPKYSSKRAMEILQSLTPWKIKW